MNNEAVVAAMIGLPIIVALIQMIKAVAPGIPGNILPVIALSLGLGYTLGGAAWSPGPVETSGVNWFGAVIAGIILGLSASGFYEAGAIVVSNVAPSIGNKDKG